MGGRLATERLYRGGSGTGVPCRCVCQLCGVPRAFVMAAPGYELGALGGPRLVPRRATRIASFVLFPFFLVPDMPLLPFFLSVCFPILDCGSRELGDVRGDLKRGAAPGFRVLDNPGPLPA